MAGENGSGNMGVIASEGATVAGVNVASGIGASISVGAGDVTVRPSEGGRDSREEIRQLLAQMAGELQASDIPERADLVDAAQSAQEELLLSRPRLGLLRTLARTLRESVAGISALASLAVTIEHAIRGL
jgi:hypothetical protein